MLPSFQGSMAQNYLGDQACGNGDQHVVRADLNPLVATWRSAQPVGSPVFHHILVASVVGRKPVSAVKTPIRACATALGVWRSLGCWMSSPNGRAGGLCRATRLPGLAGSGVAPSGSLFALGLRLGPSGAEAESQRREGQGKGSSGGHVLFPFRVPSGLRSQRVRILEARNHCAVGCLLRRCPPRKGV